jgi:hypothetical protein
MAVKHLEDKIDEPVTIEDGGGSITVDGTVALSNPDGVLLDGVSSTIRATVKDYTNSNPLTVIQVDTNGDPVVAGGADGALLDGVSGSIRATVKDYTNSNPLTVVVVDTNGDPASLGGGTQYTEDVASVADPVGTMQMGVRLDSLVAITGTDGDNIAARSTNKGEFYVKHVDSIPVTDNGGTLTVDGTVTANAGTGPFLVAGVDAHDVPLTGPNSPVLVGGRASAAAPTDVSADGDAVRAWRLRNGAEAVVLTVAGALVGGDAANGLDVDVTRLPALVAGTANIGDVDVLTMPLTRVEGAEAHDAPIVEDPVLIAFKASAAAPSDVSADNDVVRAWALRNGSQVVNLASGGTLIPGTANGIGVQQATASNLNAQVVGSIAHSSVDSGNPVKIGAKAVTTAFVTPVAAADRTDAQSDLVGRLLVTSIPAEMFISKAFNATTTQTGTDVWDPGVGKKIAVTALIVGTYGTTAARVILWFGDNADTTYTAGTDQVLAAASFAPSSTVKPGLTINFDPPVYCNTADRELHITTDAGISIDVTVHGFEF